MSKDYSQEGDPYGIAADYTAQSATLDTCSGARSVGVDVRGNSLFQPRSVPTQAEADAMRLSR